MTAQHTPGPWQLDELGIIYSGDCTELCARHSNEHVVAIVTDARPEDRRLIAAAPLMLEALREALADHSCDWNGCWHDKALTAIRVARGEDA